ncbi:MAG: hypothetical protein ACREKE_03240, partial [bacterium]
MDAYQVQWDYKKRGAEAKDRRSLVVIFWHFVSFPVTQKSSKNRLGPRAVREKGMNLAVFPGQLTELAKEKVVGSSPISRSIFK